MDECTAAKEAGRVLLEALVYTRPEELSSKPIIHEFYRKCFLAHESLTNQMDWAQAEASRSRENVNVQRLMTTDHEQDHQHQTLEEQALGMLFEAHSSLSEGIRQHDDLEKMAMDEKEMREARERSRKETRVGCRSDYADDSCLRLKSNLDQARGNLRLKDSLGWIERAHPRLIIFRQSRFPLGRHLHSEQGVLGLCQTPINPLAALTFTP